jgi:hypothetical protein
MNKMDAIIASDEAVFAGCCEDQIKIPCLTSQKCLMSSILLLHLSFSFLNQS